jgi:hypothetical protein
VSVEFIYNSFYQLHTYNSRFIPEGVVETYQIFLRVATFYQMKNTADFTGGKPIAIHLRYENVNHLVAF